MAESSVRLPPDSTGTRLRTVTNAGVASGAHQEVVTLATASGDLVAPLTDSQLRSAPLPFRDEISYWAEQGWAFNITSGVLAIASSGEQLLAALVNPAGSGRDAYLDLGEFGASADTTFRRYRNRTLTNLSNPISPNSMTASTNASVVRMYVPPNFSATNGTVVKTAHIASYQPYLTHMRGRAKISPGSSLTWTIVGPGGMEASMTASVYFEYWERPST